MSISIIFVTKSNWMTEFGAGGRHRSYQIAHELEAAFGADHVRVLTPGLDLHERQQRPDRIKGLWRVRQFAETVRRVADNPLRVTHMTGYAPRQLLTPSFIRDYKRLIDGAFRPDAVVLEDPRFAPLLAHNRRRGLPTLFAPHKFEALLAGGQPPATTAARRVHLLDFAGELDMMAACDARLFISRVEAGFVSGLGLPADYYPYVPRGELAERFARLRERRASGAVDPTQLLLIGRASFPPTRRAVAWLLSQVASGGLPDGCHLHLIGTATESLATPPNVTAHGYVSNTTLDDWLTTAGAVLLPLRSGFGTPTRLLDLAWVGVPVITSDDARHMLDLPPNTRAVPDDWALWRDAITAQTTAPPVTSLADLAAWYGGDSALVRAVGALVSVW